MALPLTERAFLGPFCYTTSFIAEGGEQISKFPLKIKISRHKTAE
jgi:hypothetical protein